MKSDIADGYRRDIKDLIVSQKVETFVCPSDGKPCWTPEMGCFVTAFGSMAKNGVEERLWTCARFKEVSL